MATDMFYFKGKCNWAKLFKPDEKYDFYGLDFYPDDVEAFQKTGTRLSPHKTEDGDVFFKIKRRPTTMIKGELVDLGKPKVFDKENQPLEKLVGNGSEVTVKIAVYDSAKGKGTRLESVRVENLVEYEGKGADPQGEVPDIPF